MLVAIATTATNPATDAAVTGTTGDRAVLAAADAAADVSGSVAGTASEVAAGRPVEFVALLLAAFLVLAFLHLFRAHRPHPAPVRRPLQDVSDADLWAELAYRDRVPLHELDH